MGGRGEERRRKSRLRKWMGKEDKEEEEEKDEKEEEEEKDEEE